MSSLVGPDGAPLVEAPDMNPEKMTEWPIGDVAPPPIPGDVDYWLDLSSKSSQTPFGVLTWIATSIELAKMTEAYRELATLNGELLGALETLTRRVDALEQPGGKQIL